MSDHLPECDRNLGSLVCICKQLRACEARVKRRSGYDWGYAAGLSAAREEVAALQIEGTIIRHDVINEAIDAIDALRQNSNGTVTDLTGGDA